MAKDRERCVFLFVFLLPGVWQEKKGKEEGKRRRKEKDSVVRVFFSGGFSSSLVWFLLREEIVFVVVEGGVCRSLGFGRWKERKKENRKWRSSSSSSSRQGNHCRSWIRTVPRSLTSQFCRGWIDMWRIFSPLLHMLPFISSAWRIVSG